MQSPSPKSIFKALPHPSHHQDSPTIHILTLLNSAASPFCNYKKNLKYPQTLSNSACNLHMVRPHTFHIAQPCIHFKKNMQKLRK